MTYITIILCYNFFHMNFHITHKSTAVITLISIHPPSILAKGKSTFIPKKPEITVGIVIRSDHMVIIRMVSFNLIFIRLFYIPLICSTILADISAISLACLASMYASSSSSFSASLHFLIAEVILICLIATTFCLVAAPR